MADPRRAAWHLLRAVEGGRRFETARDQAFSGLTQRDRRLAQEIAAGVLRSRRALDREIQEILGTRWRTTKPEIRDLLRIGAYQLRHLTRVPAYAAVQSTVEAAKPLGKKGAAFVNAVLRRVAGRGGSRPRLVPSARHSRSRADDLSCGRARWTDARSGDLPGSAPALTRLSREYSHPEWLVQRWLECYAVVATEALLAHFNQRPPLVVQPARWSRERVQQALTQAGIAWREAPGGYGLMVQRSDPRGLPGFAEGGFMVQGPGQARLLSHAALPAGSLVWDCCAAPGGKAVLLSTRGPVLASDRSLVGLRRLTETVRRAGGQAVRIFAADALRPPFAPASLDTVWLDAPCTATGVMGRHPDARWRLSPRRLEVACRRQGALLDAAAVAVRPAGWFVYSTCSLEPEENQGQVDAFLRRNPAFVRDRDDLFVWPPDSGSDGGFVAVLRRT